MHFYTTMWVKHPILGHILGLKDGECEQIAVLEESRELLHHCPHVGLGQELPSLLVAINPAQGCHKMICTKGFALRY